MKKQLDIKLINDLLWNLKQVVLLAPEKEGVVAIDKFIIWSRNKSTWVETDDSEIYK